MKKIFHKLVKKYFKTSTIENLIIYGLGILVKKTDSKIDDVIYEIVINKIKIK